MALTTGQREPVWGRGKWGIRYTQDRGGGRLGEGPALLFSWTTPTSAFALCLQTRTPPAQGLDSKQLRGQASLPKGLSLSAPASAAGPMVASTSLAKGSGVVLVAGISSRKGHDPCAPDRTPLAAGALGLWLSEGLGQ